MMRFSIPLITRRRQASYGFAVLMMLAGCSGVFYVHAAFSSDQDIQKLNNFVQSAKTDTPSAKTFRAGRDLIESENWPQAVSKFQDFVKEYPKDKDVDAALYWLAYALKKQGKKDETAQPLLRLIREFPKSSWSREAQAMLVEIGYGNAVNDVLQQTRVSNENCEIKILALQSLFEADEDRAFSFVSEALKGSWPQRNLVLDATLALVTSHSVRRIECLASSAQYFD